MGISLSRAVFFFLGLMLFAVALFPSQRELGLLYSGSGYFDKALFYLASQFHREPDDFNNGVRYLSMLYETGNTGEFEVISDRFLNRNPEHLDTLKLVASYHEQQFRMSAAAEYWKRIVAVSPEDYDYAEKLLVYYKLKKDQDSLISFYTSMRGRRLFGEQMDQEIYREIGRLYLLDKNVKAAIANYRDWITEIPYDELPYIRLIQIHTYLKDWTEALNYSTEAMERFPDNIRLYYEKSEVLNKRGLLPEDMKYYLESSSRFPQDLNIAMQALDALGVLKYEKMEEYLLDVESRFKEEIRFKESIADFYMQQKKYEKALGYYQTLNSMDSDDEVYILALADIYFELNEKEKAKEYLENYHSKDKGDYRSHHRLGDIYESLGESRGAKGEYRKALGLLEGSLEG